jgi:RimJ/RimL family protein N-acetyltransferase
MTPVTDPPIAGPAPLRTERLELVPGTAALGRAELTDRTRFAELVGAEVPASWPPPENDEQSMTFFTEYVEEHPGDVGWAAWYILLCRDDGRRTAIGTCGFKGGPDEDGTVETGYSILPEHQRRGYAPEAVTALVNWAFTHPAVSRVVAHTFPDLRPSISVLEKCGFTFAGAGAEEGTIRFERSRPSGV